MIVSMAKYLLRFAIPTNDDIPWLFKRKEDVKLLDKSFADIKDLKAVKASTSLNFIADVVAAVNISLKGLTEQHARQDVKDTWILRCLEFGLASHASWDLSTAHRL